MPSWQPSTAVWMGCMPSLLREVRSAPAGLKRAVGREGYGYGWVGEWVGGAWAGGTGGHAFRPGERRRAEGTTGTGGLARQGGRSQATSLKPPSVPPGRFKLSHAYLLAPDALPGGSSRARRPRAASSATRWPRPASASRGRGQAGPARSASVEGLGMHLRTAGHGSPQPCFNCGHPGRLRCMHKGMRPPRLMLPSPLPHWLVQCNAQIRPRVKHYVGCGLLTAGGQRKMQHCRSRGSRCCAFHARQDRRRCRSCWSWQAVCPTCMQREPARHPARHVRASEPCPPPATSHSSGRPPIHPPV